MNGMSTAWAMNMAHVLYDQLPENGYPYRNLAPDHVDVVRVLYDADEPNVEVVMSYIANHHSVVLRPDDPLTYGVTDWGINV